MEKRQFGSIGEVSCLTLGGGGIGQVWGETSREEGIASLRMAVAEGIDVIDAAPGYKLCETLIGEAFEGRLPKDFVYPAENERRSEIATTWSSYRDAVVPAFQQLQRDGLIGGWGITGVSVPATIVEAVTLGPRPHAVQPVANLLDSPGGLIGFSTPSRARDIIEAAHLSGVGVMAIRAVQAGALTSNFDRRSLHERDIADFELAAPRWPSGSATRSGR